MEEIVSEMLQGEGTVKWGDSLADRNSKGTGVGWLRIENLYYSRFSVVQWSEFLATDTEVPGSIPGTARFF